MVPLPQQTICRSVLSGRAEVSHTPSSAGNDLIAAKSCAV